tara:strand:+ start:1211 stop:1741 length:531 start_codon:yes stop_codon:yes gene_type:complete
MAYFYNFPLIPYDNFGEGNFQLMTNLLRRVGLRTKVSSNKLFFDTYEVKEGETPESLADKLYGDSELHYIIMMVNDISDRFHQWPKTSSQFIKYLNDKYANPDGVHHYEITQTSGDTTVKIDIGKDNTNYPSAFIVTNREYEQKLEDENRKIRLLVPEYVSDFVEEFNSLMGESRI